MTPVRRTALAGALTAVLTFAALLASSPAAFAVAPEKPETLGPPTGIAATAATVRGVLNPKAIGKAGWYFSYSTEPTCTAAGAGETAHEAEVEGKELAVEAPLTGLQPNKKYAYCLIATAEEGAATTPGNAHTFTTLPARPEIAGESENTGSTAATLEAQVNPNNEPTSYTFEYSTKEKAGALEGTIVKVKGKGPLEGYGDQTASVLTGALKPSETYYYRVTVENAKSIEDKATVAGAVQPFTTLPTPFTDAPTSVGSTGATFNGHLTLGTVPSQYYFAYNTTGVCTGGGATPTVEVRSTTSEAALMWEVPRPAQPELGIPGTLPLTPDENYTVCLVLVNQYGSQVGPAQHFRTPPLAPAITSETAVGEGLLGVALQAVINPNLQETTYFFETASSQAALEAGEGTKIEGAPPAPALPAELKELPASVTTTAAQPGVSYYYRAVAENQSTATEGKPADGEIHLYGLPLLTAGEAENITRTSATISGTVNPQGLETTYHFAYISKAGYELALAEEKADPYAEGESTTPTSAGSSTEPQVIPATQITGLRPGETYHYALVATSAIGTETSSGGTLTALPASPPAAQTGQATGVTATTATLTGTLTTNGLQSTYGFEVATEPDHYGPATGLGTIGGAQTEEVHLTLGELQPGTTYYYRLTATNADGTTEGQPQSFTTTGLPYLLTVPAAALTVPIPATALGQEPHTTIVPPLTNKQKLAKALKVCRKDRKKSKRQRCERAARKHYPITTSKRKG
jgi:phosphodiesterase/alkaline phosphatase D-like protein